MVHAFPHSALELSGSCCFWLLASDVLGLIELCRLTLMILQHQMHMQQPSQLSVACHCARRNKRVQPVAISAV